jgi:hypothetical protein
MACGLNSNNQYLSVNNNSALQPGSGDFALSVWANPSFNPAGPITGTYASILSLGSYNSGILIRCQASGTSGNDNFYINGTAYNWAPYTWLSTGVWANIVVSRISSTVKLYVNSFERLSVTNSTAISQTTSTSIGRSTHATTQSWMGSIADVALWKGAGLIDAEINALASGFTADQIRPQSLTFYAPLISNFQDVRSGLAITNVNSATVATHPRIIT